MIKIDRATVSDAPEISRLYRTSCDTALPFLPKLHTPKDDLEFFSKHIFPQNEVFLARNPKGRILGFIAFDETTINELFLMPGFGRQGIGTRLLDVAKRQRKKLQLWTFKRNEVAKQFYAKQGFKPIRETDGSGNEEKEPDVLYEWTAE